MTGWDDINALKDQLQSHPFLGDPTEVLILPCHGSMASSEQRLIFDKPDSGVRKIVLATNMAETSITINDVVFVVDCGKAKETSYDALNNTPCLLPTWISKASARQVQNAIEYLKVIGALDEEEELTILVAGLSVRDPFLSPFDKKDLADSAKAQFSCQDYSDHLALIRAYEGWKEAERDHLGYDYCWKNFLSAQTLKAIDSLKKQFLFLLKDTGLVDENLSTSNKWSRDENIVRAVICAGLFPGICSVVNKERSIALKTMEDGQVMLYSNSVNGKEAKIPYPWLIFNEKVKVNSVFLRDSTAISDSVLLLFGGNICRGGLDGHLKMLAGYLEFFMTPDLAYTYVTLRKELEELILSKLQNPRMDTQTWEELLQAIRLLASSDPCSGRFVFGRQEIKPKKIKTLLPASTGDIGGDNPKGQLQTLLTRAGHDNPTYKTKQLNNNQFKAMVEFNGMQFISQSCGNKKLAEKERCRRHWSGELRRCIVRSTPIRPEKWKAAQHAYLNYIGAIPLWRLGLLGGKDQ
ncbi:hypothetical protein HPP92_004445 [Vanilla planifolia]|uniref:Helicase C-terminal domain-containing protein n=1 Tax=Vanilla planifolia TaxID=51239 RepID=A0A835VEH2_VANPL|nr:hypothetical protein HPP92_004445 [Vanilla planifolia]